MTNWGPLVPQTSTRPVRLAAGAGGGDPRASGPDKVAAFFCEPVIGAGGVHLPPEGYIQGVADLCAEHGILLVIDSVICGFGRLGTWFGVERWPDVKPDDDHVRQGRHRAATSRSAASSSSEQIAAPYFEAPGGPMFRHGATYAGHPVGLRGRAGDARHLRARGPDPPRPATSRGRCTTRWRRSPTTPAAGEVRGGLGFLAAVGVAPGRRRRRGRAGWPRARARPACSCAPLLGGVAVSPPLICEQEHIDLLAQAIEAGLDAVAAV